LLIDLMLKRNRVWPAGNGLRRHGSAFAARWFA
jgi:hypothetical protein